MRKLTALLSIVFLLLLGFTVWFWLGGTLRAEVSVQSARAADYPEAFAAIRKQVNAGQAPQLLGGEAVGADPEAYALVDITVKLTNRGLVPAEWLHVSAVAAPGDIAVYALAGEGGDIVPRDRGQVSLRLITTRPDAGHEVVIQYYTHGVKREITVG